MTETYKIVRFFQDSSLERLTLATGLSLEEAQEHCNNPETSSNTCTAPSLVALTRQVGPWFDGYYKE